MSSDRPESDVAPEEQADNEVHFLADPDVAGAFERMLDEFSRETDRGSILIAADIVSAHLERIIAVLAPEKFTPKRIKSLLNYPGPLSNFAARADIAFMADFVGDTAHRSIDLLRGLRNKALTPKARSASPNTARRCEQSATSDLARQPASIASRPS